MSQELKPCESCGAPRHQQYPQRNGDSICAAGGATYGLATAPVPPAGGEVEFTQSDFDELEVAEVILAQQGLSNLAGACSTAYAALNSYRTHVTRLQAEIAALHQRLTIADQRVDELEQLLMDWYAANCNDQIQVEDSALHIVTATAEAISKIPQ